MRLYRLGPLGKEGKIEEATDAICLLTEPVAAELSDPNPSH